MSLILVCCAIAMAVARVSFGCLIPWPVIIAAAAVGLLFDFIVFVLLIIAAVAAFTLISKAPRKH